MAKDFELSLELRTEKVKEHHRQVKTGIGELGIVRLHRRFYKISTH
ncbi:hypothetical protein [Desulfobacter hydrogenophilus]|nr:hypothetical protein [Desulfobacter hydrogenophilus]NDY71094.1 hypothetical protein [Desulfobacter hydrogenophilus]